VAVLLEEAKRPTVPMPVDDPDLPARWQRRQFWGGAHGKSNLTVEEAWSPAAEHQVEFLGSPGKE